jgi:O-antigen ligase
VARPATTLELAAVGVVVGIALLRVDVALMLLVGSGPLEAISATGPFGVSVTKTTGALCFASFALLAVRTRRPILFERNQGYVFGILALAMMSTLQADDTAAAMTTTTRYASYAAFYFVLTQLGYDRRLPRRLAWVLVGSATLSAYLGLHNYLTGETQVATLSYANEGDYAFLLAATLPLAFWLLGSRPVLRPFLVAAIGMLSAAILLSLSRAAYVGLGTGIVFVLLTQRRRFRIVLLGGALAAIAVTWAIYSNPARFEAAVIGKERVAEYNVTTRYSAWGAAARLSSDHPLLGVGPGNFATHFYEATGAPPGTHNLGYAHDAYLDVAAEIGIPALILFLLYLGTTYGRLRYANRYELGPPGLAQALSVSLVVAMVHSIFLSEQYYLSLWLIGGLATLLWASRDSREKSVGVRVP